MLPAHFKLWPDIRDHVYSSILCQLNYLAGLAQIYIFIFDKPTQLSFKKQIWVFWILLVFKLQQKK